MAIVSRNIQLEQDGTIRMRTEFNAQSTIDSVRATRECNETGYFGDKNNEWRYVGEIPEEMFTYVPWLIMSRRAALAGDKVESQHYLMKFLELYPIFMGGKKTRYWRGSRAVLL